MPAKTRTLLVPGLCALLLAACGGSGAAVKEPSGRFAVTLDDYLIRPETVHVPGGGIPLTVTVTNRGRLGHTFRIRAKTRNVLALTTLEPGETRKSKTFRLKRGTYTMYCVLANHEELGMYGTLVVG
jgi:plastocyanin